MTPARDPKQGKYIDLDLILIGFVRFSMRMGWKWVGIDGKGYANTTNISEFHPHIPAGQIFQKKGLSGGDGRLGRRRPAALFFFFKSGRWDVGMEFGDVGCVRISFAINSNPFSAHSD